MWGSAPLPPGGMMRLRVAWRAGVVGGACALAAAGCGGGPPAPAGSAAALLRPLAPADTTLRFLAGGAPGELLVRRGGHQARLVFGNEEMTIESAPAFDYLAAWRDPKSTTERFLGQGEAGPLLAEGGQAWALPGWPAGASAVQAAFSADGRRLAVGLSGSGLPGSLGVWSIPPGAPKFLGAAGGPAARLLDWSGDGRSLALTDADNTLSIYRLPASKPVYRQAFNPGADGRITAIDLSPDGDWFVVATNTVVVRAWKLPFMNAQLSPWGRVKAVFFAGDAGSVITVDETNSAIRWAVNYGNVRAAVARSLSGLDRVMASAAGHYFAGVDSAGVLRGWRAVDLEPLSSSAGDQPFRR